MSNVIASCYFPLGNNCSVLTCPVGDGLDLTLSILRCADPPAIRIAYGNGFVSVFDHTFDHSEVVPVEYFPNNTALNVTLDHLCPSDIGLKVSGARMRARARVCVCVCECVCVCVCVCECVCVCVCVLYICMCMHACVYILYTCTMKRRNTSCALGDCLTSRP